MFKNIASALNEFGTFDGVRKSIAISGGLYIASASAYTIARVAFRISDIIINKFDERFIKKNNQLKEEA